MIAMDHLLTLDKQHVWHAGLQVSDQLKFPTGIVKKAKGPYIELSNGHTLIDAGSSWWCKSLGHGHPELRKALIQQANQFEHIVATDLTTEAICQLSQALSELTQHRLNRVFYASDGANAIETAIKMSYQARANTGKPEKNRVISLHNTYCGETLYTLSLNDMPIFREPFSSLLPANKCIAPIPYTTDITATVRNEAFPDWENLAQQLEMNPKHITAIVFEPIVQASAGMKFYSPKLLTQLQQWAKQYDIHLIADEIFTALGRTGTPLACDHASIQPDFICLGKALTGGWLPMSAVLTAEQIYEQCKPKFKTHSGAFMHSHTYSGNPLAAAVANKHLSLLQQENIYPQVKCLSKWMNEHMQSIACNTKLLTGVRALGAITAAELPTMDPQLNYRIAAKAFKLGAFLRPFGNTLYWCPPLNTPQSVINQLAEITEQAILESIAK